ncbi:hypothetical protein ULMS_01630 [Patiriisocius marinistellae]|uniref:Secretion system C-terminal sorting domain-containing protein n=1 Tax=Patiriisocius marinistellae TaxID=2494560 RepID=A0A5J4FX91_9FLAO|nr:hypothetical protein [Patiriisocius marinistellae]GEQ84655.1 hypothetical protein ULMS_01630 [Patiriisocius marinistellae]
MKTTKKMSSVVKVLLFVFLIGTTNTLLANGENPKLTISKENDKSFAIAFENQKKLDVKITFRDAASVILFKETVKDVKQLSKTFDLKGLPDGKYFLEVENKKSVYNQLITIKNEKLFYNEAGVTTINKPVTYVKEDTLYVSSNIEKNVAVQITIFNNVGEIVHQETSTVQNNLNKKYIFLDGRPNDYKVSVKYNGLTFNL